MTLNLVFNARNQLYGSGGTSKWSEEVLEALNLLPSVSVRTIAPPTHHLGNGPAGYLWEQLILPFLLRKGEILLSPANLGPILVKSQALVIHDLLPFTHKSDFSKIYSNILRLIYFVLIRRSKAIFTVSESVRHSLAEMYPKYSSKFVVIGGGVKTTTMTLKSHTPQNSNYCLIVGAHIKRKNIEFIYSIWPEVYKASGCHLVSTSRSSRDRSLAGNIGIENQTYEWHQNFRDLKDEEISELYHGAKFVLQPSTGEGFGLPILEGMNCGTPFISNDVGVAREICVGASRVMPIDHENWLRFLIDATANRKSRQDSKIQIDEASKRTWILVATKIVNYLS